MSDRPLSDERPLERPSESERAARSALEELFRESPIQGGDLLEQLSLYLRPQVVSHVLAMAELYRQILDVHGAVFDLGTRYGRNMVTFSSLRRVYEPYNYFRQIVGFDTFSGFPDNAARDQDGGASAATRRGTFGVPPGYAEHLSRLLAVHEQESPLAHIPRHELRAGDVATELPAYLREHPETVVALAYFDFDLYEPTRAALEAILPHTTRGSILAFDQPTHATYPGETVAFKEVLDIKRHKLRRFSYQSHPAYIVME